jgi:CRISPR-associated protein Cas2
MGRANRYSGVLKPLEVGRGSREVSVVVLYDVEEDRLRGRVAEICLDYGLERIQFSAFFGKLNRNRRQELALLLQREVEKESARIRIIPVCEDDLRDAWALEQYRPNTDTLAAKAGQGVVPKLKVLSLER